MRVKNHFPLFSVINAPFLESARTESSLSAILSHSSVFMLRDSPVWSFNLDMEITELDLIYKRDMGRLWELGIEVPVMDSGNGFMDGFLDSWHKAFAFPDYGRSRRPSNEFLYSIRRNDSAVIEGGNGSGGLGDIRLTVKKMILTGDPCLSIRAELELPTGMAYDGHGSGGIDSGATILLDKEITEQIMSYWNFGVTFPGDYKGKETVGLRNFFHAAAGIEALPWKGLGILGQVVFQGSPFPKTGVAPIDRVSALLTIGLRYHRTEKDSIELSISEDPNTAGAPDVTFNLGYKKRF